MYLVTADEMRRLDQKMIQEMGVPAIALMESAGKAIASEVALFSRAKGWLDGGRKSRWVILVGKGNNGGDGIVVARYLLDEGFHVSILYAQEPDELTGEAAIQRDVAQKMGIDCQVFAPKSFAWEQYDGIVDALLGTGAKGAPRGNIAMLIREANASRLPIISADIPSGLDADTGQIFDPCIQATRTVTLAFRKRGLAQYPGKMMAGEITVGNIGIWQGLAAQLPVQTYLLDRELFQTRLEIDPDMPRSGDTHKGTYGHLLVIAGSPQMSGAGLLASKAALRSGCGLVTWAVDHDLLQSLVGQVPEVMLLGLAGPWTQPGTIADLIGQMHGRQAAVIGPGLGRFAGDVDWLRALWEGTDIPLVLDADALNMLADADDLTAWRKRKGAVILTPHPGEMARLSKLATAQVQANRIETARQLADLLRVHIVLKGAGTVIATPDGVTYVNPTGNPGMATGGSGDVLAGMIGSLLAQGLDADRAACLGVWLHGAAGDRAAAKRNQPYSLIASDLIEEL